MKETENIKTLYIFEQNLLKSCTEKLIASSNEIIHDNILSVFDNIDELNRTLHKYLITENIIPENKISKKKKEQIYEELDSLYLKIHQ